MKDLLFAFLFVGSVFAFFMCTPDRKDCAVEGATQCADNTVMMCTNDGYWFEAIDCSTLYLFDGGTSKGLCIVDTDNNAICEGTN